MKQLVFLATAWGTKYGGINSFNLDLCKAVADELKQRDEYQVVCVVLNADEKAMSEKGVVEVVSLMDSKKKEFDISCITKIKEELQKRDVHEIVWWVGHDVYSGEIALALRDWGGSNKVALIHHMDYSKYEPFKSLNEGNSKERDGQTFEQKFKQQKKIFPQADMIFAVGPKLKESAEDLLLNSPLRESVSKLIPGLIQRNNEDALPNNFKVIMAGRLEQEIKQLMISINACGEAYNSYKSKSPKGQTAKKPTIFIYGVTPTQRSEDLVKKVREATGELLPINAYCYTEDREEFWSELEGSSVCLMPSLYEGFGLVAWEAIGMKVPVILTEESGVSDLLHNDHLTDYVEEIEITGEEKERLVDLANCIERVYLYQKEYKDKAIKLWQELWGKGYTWERTAHDFLEALAIKHRKTSQFGKESGIDISEDQPLLDLLHERTDLASPYHFDFADSQEEAAFQGRHDELEWLREQFNKVLQSSKSRTLLIKGEKGVGKSRLIDRFVREFLKTKEAYIIIRAFDEGYFRPEQIFAQLAKDLWYQYSEALSSTKQRDSIRNTLGIILQERFVGVDGSIQNIQIDKPLLNLLHELAQIHPLVLIIENLHNASPMGIDFFNSTFSAKAKGALLVIGTIRSDSEGILADDMRGKIHVSRRQTKPLRNLCSGDAHKLTGDAHKLISSLCSPASRSLGDDFYQKLINSTDCNPYLIVEIIKYLKQQKILWKSQDGWVCQESEELPRWTTEYLQDFVENELEKLRKRHPPAEEDIKTAAVIGPRFLEELLRKVAGYSDDQVRDFQTSLNVMRDRGLLTVVQKNDEMILPEPGVDTYTFQPQIIQETLYKFRHGANLHGRIAQLLEEFYNDEKYRKPYRERLRFWCAHHYLLSNDYEKAKSFLLKLIHATQFPFETIWLLTRMLKNFASHLTLDEEIRLRQNLAQKYSEVGRLDDAFANYNDARRKADSSNALNSLAIELTADMAWIRVKQARFEHAKALFNEAIERLKKTTPESKYLPTKVYRLYGGLYLEQLTSSSIKDIEGTFKNALAYTHLAKESLDRYKPFDPEGQHHNVLILNNIGRLFLEISSKLDFPEMTKKECYEKARDYFDEARDALKAAVDSSSLEAYIQNNYGIIAFRSGAYPEAKSFYEKSFMNTKREENVFLRTKTLLNLAELYLVEKQYSQAFEVAEEGRWYADLLEHPIYQFQSYCLLGKAYLGLKNFKEAHSCFVKAHELDKSVLLPRQMITLIEKKLQLEDNNE